MRLSYLVALSLSGLTLVTVQQREIVVRADQEFPGKLGPVRFLGACRATEQTMECWDAHGIMDPKLTAAMLNEYKQGHFRFEVAYGRKSRLLVFEGPRYLGYGSRFEFDDYANRIGVAPDSKREFMLSQRMVPLDQVTCDVFGGEWTSLPPSARFPIKAGQVFSYAGVNFRIAKIGAREAPINSDQPPTWSIFLKYSGSSEPNTSRDWTAIAFDGTVIQTVDRNGVPVIAPLRSRRMGGYPPDPNVVDAEFRQRNGGDGEIYLSSNIDPSKIRRCFLTGGRKIIVRFADLPLEPK